MKIIINILVVISLISVAFLVSCTDSTQIKQRSWKIVWQDEFNSIPADSLPDATKWNIREGGDGWGNQEKEFYTKRKKNVSIDSVNGVGCLKLTVRAESYSGSGWTSGRIDSKGKYEPQYGLIIARIKLPYGTGLWPAFWMLGANIDSKTWPQCGEVDIMEYKGQEPSLIHGTIHGPGYYGGGGITQSYGFIDMRFDNDYHTFAIVWTENGIDFYVDATVENGSLSGGTLYRRITSDDVSGKGEWVFNHSFYLLLNVAVGGNYVGLVPNANTLLPQTMYVDYVRVYEEVK